LADSRIACRLVLDKFEEFIVNQSPFHGVFSLLLTPFQPNGAIDWASYAAYVDWQLASEPAGLFAVCGSSEMQWLTLDERLALARRAVELAGSTPVVATANLGPDRAYHTYEMEQMAATGVSGLVLVPPTGIANEPAEFVEYFGGLADNAPCPVLLYEWPFRQNHLVPPESYAQLVQHHGVVGIKDTTCTLEGIQAKLQVAGASTIFQANTPLLLESIRLGVGGVMAIIATVASDLLVACWELAQRKDDEAAVLHQQLVFLDSVLRFGYPIGAKWLVNQRGLPMATRCRASASLSAEAIPALGAWLAATRRVFP